MKYYSKNDLYTNSETILSELENNDEIVITNNDKPIALMIDIENDNVDEFIQTIRQVKAMNALKNMRQKAALQGYMSDNKINSLINEARNELF